MTVIRVNPDDVRAYGTAAQGQFDTARAELEALVRDAVGVRYQGPNAVQFKTECGRMAATSLSADLAGIADAIRTSTSNIAGSLGGAPVSISVNGAPIAPPDVPGGDGSVDVDTAGLEGLKPTVQGHIATVVAQLDAHMNRLQGTDWVGTAKETAVQTVSGFTNSAKTKAANAEQSVLAFIDNQINSVLAADR
jgi:hypothetical protein